MKKLILILIITLLTLSIVSQEETVFKGELEIHAFTRGFAVSGGVTLLTHEMLPKEIKPFWRKTISVLVGIAASETLNRSLNMDCSFFLPVGEVSGSFTVVLLLPNGKRQKRKFRGGNLWQ